MSLKVAEPDVRIRPPATWVVLLVAGGIQVVLAMSASLTGQEWSSGSAILGAIFIGEALWLCTLGATLTPEFIKVLGIRRQTIPWASVQAVQSFPQMGECRVRLVLTDGQQVNLRAPITAFYFLTHRSAKFTKDFHTIGQHWLTHRGPDWVPTRPEAPPLPPPA